MKRFTQLAFLTTALGLLVSSATIPAYNLYGHKWAIDPIPFYVNPVNADVSQTAAISAIMAGAAVWSTQSNADISYSYAGTTTGSAAQYNGKNEVFFRPESSGSLVAKAYWWVDASNRILDGDIVLYDATYRFFTGSTGCTSGMYVDDTVAHEFGHVLGLAHSGVAAATMYSTVGYCSQALRTLDPDDMDAIELVYPPASTPTEPAPPKNPNAVAASSSAINLSWIDASTNEDGFDIERSTGGGSFVRVRSVAANVSAVSDTGLASSTTYSYRVRSFNSGGTGVSSAVSATTLAPTSPPASPTGPTPGNGALNVNVDADLAWAPAARADKYDIYFGTSVSPPLYQANATATALALPRLAEASVYYWRVVAKNAVGSAGGSTWSFTTRSRGPKAH